MKSCPLSSSFSSSSWFVLRTFALSSRSSFRLRMLQDATCALGSFALTSRSVDTSSSASFSGLVCFRMLQVPACTMTTFTSSSMFTFFVFAIFAPGIALTSTEWWSLDSVSPLIFLSWESPIILFLFPSLPYCLHPFFRWNWHLLSFSHFCHLLNSFFSLLHDPSLYYDSLPLTSCFLVWYLPVSQYGFLLKEILNLSFHWILANVLCSGEVLIFSGLALE